MKFLTLLLFLGTTVEVLAGTVTITNPAGKTTTTNRTRTAPGAFQRTNTFPNGSTSTYNGNFQGQGNGNYTGTIDRTGNSQTYQINGKIQRNAGNTTNQGTVTNQNGQVGNFDRQRNCNDRSCSGTNTYQTPQEQTYTKTYHSNCQSGTCTKNSTIVGAKGNSTTIDTTADRVDQGIYRGTTTVTTPQGQPRTSTFERTPNR